MAAGFQSVTCTNSSEYIYPTIGGNSSNYIILDGDTMRVTTRRTISTSTDLGYNGELCFDTEYIYVCVADNSWRRAPLQSF